MNDKNKNVFVLGLGLKGKKFLHPEVNVYFVYSGQCQVTLNCVGLFISSSDLQAQTEGMTKYSLGYVVMDRVNRFIPHLLNFIFSSSLHSVELR